MKSPFLVKSVYINDLNTIVMYAPLGGGKFILTTKILEWKKIVECFHIHQEEIISSIRSEDDRIVFYDPEEIDIPELIRFLKTETITKRLKFKRKETTFKRPLVIIHTTDKNFLDKITNY